MTTARPLTDQGVAEIIARFERDFGPVGKELVREDRKPCPARIYWYVNALRLCGRFTDALHLSDLFHQCNGGHYELRSSIVLIHRGETLLDMGRHTEAEAVFREACDLKSPPSRAVSHLRYLSWALAAQERHQEALSTLKKALAIATSSMKREDDRDHESGNCGIDDDDLAQLHFYMAHNQRAMGLLSDAEANYREVLKYEPARKSANKALTDIQAALVLAQIGKIPEEGKLNETGPTEMMEIYKIKENELRASGKLPGNRWTFYQAQALCDVGREREAIALCDSIEARLLAQPPAQASNQTKLYRIYLLRGNALKESDRYPEAAQAYVKACEYNAETPPRVFLAGALAWHERFEEAIDVLRDAVNREGDRDEVYLNMAMCQRTLGRLEEAAESALRALAITPDYPVAARVLADIEAALLVKNQPSETEEED